jgi:dTDP-4-amino-4,6-dideoxygalactose transaminase
MISYDGWDREYNQNKELYLDVFDKFMSQSNYENCESFEKEFANMVNRKYAVGVASATDALYYSLLANHIGPGDEVLVTDFSWISTASCISMTGAVPVFCDIDINTYHLNIDSVKRMLSTKTKALIYTHLFGNMSDTDDLINLCKEHNIVFIEDAAQSLGSSLNNVKAGSIGDCSSFSFNTNKVVAGINGGGVFLTDCQQQYELVKKIRRHGKGLDFETLGYNSRLYVLNSEIIKLRLRNHRKNQLKRQSIAKRYIQEFESLPLHVQKMTSGLDHNYHKFVIRFDDSNSRNKAKKLLNASVHYDTPLSENSMYNCINFRRDVCSNARAASATVLSLPVHAWLTNEEIDNIVYTVKHCF